MTGSHEHDHSTTTQLVLLVTGLAITASCAMALENNRAEPGFWPQEPSASTTVDHPDDAVRLVRRDTAPDETTLTAFPSPSHYWHDSTDCQPPPKRATPVRKSPTPSRSCW